MEAEMNRSTDKDVESWEGEGGATPAPPAIGAASMSGTENQVEWAERIKFQVNAEFDRVAKVIESATSGQSLESRTDAQAILAILETKRAEVMSREQAGYFIHDWQEISDQVREMITRDPQYKAIKANKAARRK
jgi:hypothetical protein